jgi:hypothetical protein
MWNVECGMSEYMGECVMAEQWRVCPGPDPIIQFVCAVRHDTIRDGSIRYDTGGEIHFSLVLSCPVLPPSLSASASIVCPFGDLSHDQILHMSCPLDWMIPTALPSNVVTGRDYDIEAKRAIYDPSMQAWECERKVMIVMTIMIIMIIIFIVLRVLCHCP